VLSLTQFLIFELGHECNLRHSWCPNVRPDRWYRLDTSMPLDDVVILASVRKAYRRYGFVGMVGWHFHNEPLMQADRMFGLMEQIIREVPEARFVLWTNGLLLPDDCSRFAAFDLVHCTCYDDADEASLKAKLDSIPGFQTEKVLHVHTVPDGRLTRQSGSRHAPCRKPFVEFILDAYGNHHACCYDWQGQASLGNVYADGFDVLVSQWHDLQGACVGGWMHETAPLACLECGHKEVEWSYFVPEIAERQSAFIDDVQAAGVLT